MEFIIIDGERVAIPQEVVSDSRAAVAAWLAANAHRSSVAAPSSTTSDTPAE